MRQNMQDTSQDNTRDSEHAVTGMWGSRDDKPQKIITTPRTPGPSSHQMWHKGHQMCQQMGHQPHKVLGTAAPMTHQAPGNWSHHHMAGGCCNSIPWSQRGSTVLLICSVLVPCSPHPDLGLWHRDRGLWPTVRNSTSPFSGHAQHSPSSSGSKGSAEATCMGHQKQQGEN